MAKDYTIYIGQGVKKRSGKPFKSGFKINTVKAVTTNPFTGKMAFSFIEDDSTVHVGLCCMAVFNCCERRGHSLSQDMSYQDVAGVIVEHFRCYSCDSHFWLGRLWTKKQWEDMINDTEGDETS